MSCQRMLEPLRPVGFFICTRVLLNYPAKYGGSYRIDDFVDPSSSSNEGASDFTIIAASFSI